MLFRSILKYAKNESGDNQIFNNPDLVDYEEISSLAPRISLPLSVSSENKEGYMKLPKPNIIKNSFKVPHQGQPYSSIKEIKKEKRSNSLLNSREEQPNPAPSLNKPIPRVDSISGKLKNPFP